MCKCSFDWFYEIIKIIAGVLPDFRNLPSERVSRISDPILKKLLFSFHPGLTCIYYF